MPEWVKKFIQSKKADIIVLTEVSTNIPNWSEELKKAFPDEQYHTFSSSNLIHYQNDIVIAIKKDKFDIGHSVSFPAKKRNIPDHLEVNCIEKTTKKIITIVGVRINSSAEPEQKRNELDLVLNSVRKKRNVIIAGDFNNFRRGYYNKDWCLEILTSSMIKEGFRIITPEGGSIYEKASKFEYQFPEDHISFKGDLALTKVYDYDRDFTSEDPSVYKWGKDFTRYIGNGKYEYIDDPFPDHAIIEADIKLIKNGGKKIHKKYSFLLHL